MSSIVRLTPRPYTGARLAVSHGAPAFASPSPATSRAAKAKSKRGASGVFLVTVLAVTGGWIFAASNPGNLAAMAARVGDLALGSSAPGVEIARAEARRTVSDGQTILYVDGTLANKATSALKSPRLVITIVGADDQPLYTWTTKVAQSRIEASHEASFQARLSSPPDVFKSIKVSLAKEG